MDLGSYLKQRREESGITLEKVAADTRIRAQMLQDLEDNRVDALPEKVFVRGFVMAYTQAIRVDADEALDLMDEFYAVRTGHSADTRTMSHVQPEPEGTGLRFRAAYLLLVLLALLTFSVAWFVNKANSDGKAVSAVENTDVNSGTTRGLDSTKSDKKR
jgi:cytoskeletal protein RodZ